MLLPVCGEAQGYPHQALITDGGSWAIYAVSSDGTIVQTLSKSITSTRDNEDITLTLKGNSVTFSIDNEPHTVTVNQSIQPIKVAITCYHGGTVTTNNFSYSVLSN
jgi:hypothetical protein